MQWLRLHPYIMLLTALVLTLAGISAGQAGFDDSHARFAMPQDPLFVKECGGCHTAYAPGLLTAGEWRQVMDDLQNHYGDDASLDGPTRLAILRWLEEGAADAPGTTRLMRRITETTAKSKDLPRITASRLFRYEHDEMPGYVWTRKAIGRKSNCGACHIRANAGRYDEDEVKIPR